MATTYLKRCSAPVATDHTEVRAIAARIISDVAKRGEAAAEHYAREVDGVAGPVRIDQQQQQQQRDAGLPRSMRRRIQRLHENAQRFAQAHRQSARFDGVEVAPGHKAGQRHLPLRSVGLLADSSGFAGIGAALAAATCAKAAGVPRIAACVPRRADSASTVAMDYALRLAGVDQVLNIGGVQGMASLAFGLFGVPAVQSVVGGETRYVNAARAILFPDMGERARAGTGSFALIAADHTPARVAAACLLRGLSDARNDKVRILADSTRLAEAAVAGVLESIEASPMPDRESLRVFWKHRSEVLVASTRPELVAAADGLAPRRLQVLASDHHWWLDRLAAYGSLLLGDAPPAMFGEVPGRDHWGQRMAAGSGFYPDGISVHDFMRLATWQSSSAKQAEADPGEGNKPAKATVLHLSNYAKAQTR